MDEEHSRGKRKALDAGESGSTKKHCLSQEEDVVGTSGCLDESDNEFVVDSDSEEFDSADDSSDVEEDGEDQEDITCVVCGFQIAMKSNGDGNFCLVQYPNRKDFKLIVPETDVKRAITSSKEFYSNGNIPVFDALDLEITKNGKSGMIAYCKTLKSAENHYKFINTLKEQDETQTIMKTNSLCIIRLENPDETFATTDLGEPVPLK